MALEQQRRRGRGQEGKGGGKRAPDPAPGRKGRPGRGKKAAKLTASTADKHRLYELSVQNPGHEVDFVARTFKRRFRRKALRLREDFCGTALFSTSWVESDPARRATGIDLDRRVLAWARRHNLADLPDDVAGRVELIQGDVLDPPPGNAPFDVIVGFNYSYFTFRDRPTLRRYFEGALAGLGDEGLFFLDLFGGPEAQTVLEESREEDGFTYVWDQASYDPIGARARNHIHFRFPDGTELPRAFTYDWRLWQLVEVRELLSEAGFGRVDVYWEDADADGEGTGTFRRRTRVDNELCWNAYVVSSRGGEPDVRRRSRLSR